MELKIIEGHRIAPGEVLVVVPGCVVSMEEYQWLQKEASRIGIKLMIVPRGSQVFTKAPDSGYCVKPGGCECAREAQNNCVSWRAR